MAASSRERQRKHRELQRQAGARIVDYILPLETHEKIKNLALAGNKSKKAAIIELVDRAMLNGVSTENGKNSTLRNFVEYLGVSTEFGPYRAVSTFVCF